MPEEMARIVSVAKRCSGSGRSRTCSSTNASTTRFLASPGTRRWWAISRSQVSSCRLRSASEPKVLAAKNASLRSLIRRSTRPFSLPRATATGLAYSFITPDEGGNDAFVHITALEAAGLRTLSQDQRVEYDLAPDNRGRESAANVRAI